MFLDKVGLVSPPAQPYDNALAQAHVAQVASLTSKGLTNISPTSNALQYNADSDGDNGAEM